MKPDNAQPPARATIIWPVVIERSRTPRLHLIRLRADIGTVMEEILALYHRKKPWWSRWVGQDVVEIASIHTDTNINMDNLSGNGREVSITERDPSDLISATHEVSAASFRNSVGANGLPKAILLRPKLTYVGLCILAIAVLLTIVIPGVLLGVVAHQAELGVALSAAITAILTLVGKVCGWPA